MGTVNFVDIPADLKESCRFCVWKKEKGKGKSTRLTKVPYNPVTGQKAQSNNPETFSEFVTAMKTFAMGGYDGIGIRVASGIGAIDIDHCIREDGTLNDVAASILGFFKDAYFERSPSGTGLRGFFHVDEDYVFDKTVYYINNRTHGLEVYLPGATNRFVTVTGNQYRAGSVPRDMEALATVLDTFMKRKSQVVNTHIEPCSYLTDEQVLEHAKNSANGERFMDYYNGEWQKYFDNQSDADMGFLSMLSFWCGCDEEQMDRIFRSSGMMRPKWDRKQAGTTYGGISIRNAVATCQQIYLPVDAHSLAGPEDEFVDLEGEKEKAADFQADLSKVTMTLEEMKPHSNPRYGRDEIGIGNAFADFFFPIARFNRDRGIWYVYDGRIWRPDEGGLKVAELAKLLADKLYTFALQVKDEDTRNRYIRRVQKLQLRKNRKTMVEDAKSVHPIPMSAFDRNTSLFNCQNGTLDLKTLEFREHSPEDFLTMVSGVVYDPDSVCPRWDSFINEVMCNDTDLASYLQRALGYALTGDTALECMFILYGATSRNGKGTTMETFLKIMGDYGKTSNPEMLSTKFGSTNASGPSEEIARLAGVRFVNISEPEKKITFNAALVKRLTGNDTINARYLHENSFDFRPVFKIFINTNYLPNVSDMTLFDSGRLKIIPFKRHFSEAEQDKSLKSLFAEQENLSGIFNWCLEGYRAFRRYRLESPSAVVEAIRDYRNDSDRIGQFIEAWMEEGEAYEVRSSAAYKLYSDWCKKYNYNAENVKNFKNAMEKRFTIERRRPKDGGEKTSLIIGCRFREQELGEEEEQTDVLQGAKSDFKAL